MSEEPLEGLVYRPQYMCNHCKRLIKRGAEVIVGGKYYGPECAKYALGIEKPRSKVHRRKLNHVGVVFFEEPSK